jgi:hypothetical protein
MVVEGGKSKIKDWHLMKGLLAALSIMWEKGRERKMGLNLVLHVFLCGVVIKLRASCMLGTHYH